MCTNTITFFKKRPFSDSKLERRRRRYSGHSLFELAPSACHERIWEVLSCSSKMSSMYSSNWLCYNISSASWLDLSCSGWHQTQLHSSEDCANVDFECFFPHIKNSNSTKSHVWGHLDASILKPNRCICPFLCTRYPLLKLFEFDYSRLSLFLKADMTNVWMGHKIYGRCEHTPLCAFL